MLIERPPQIFRSLFPDAHFRIRGEERCVYLTFDDGPIPEATPWVLDMLDSYGIKATFFMVGDNVRKYPDVYQEVVRRGHTIGNHTMHHLQGLKVKTPYYLDDIKEADGYIHSRLFRPPHGFLTPKQARLIREQYTIIMYDLITRDYSRHLTADQVFDNVRRYTRDGSIIVFHDSIKSMPRLREALPRSIEWLMEQGYQFKTFDTHPSTTDTK
jgi:peptidoglycan/xylan/chitin deacetylase (PgdA/CDA1 family)